MTSAADGVPQYMARSATIGVGDVTRMPNAAAVSRLQADRAAGFDHRIFARAASIPAAKDLVPLYEAAGVNVEAIASHIGKRKQDETEAALIDGRLDGIVCVDMFGKGYDFPKLKIAALHAPHRSLVPTLQFVGRFARTNDVATGDATLPVMHLRSLVVDAGNVVGSRPNGWWHDHFPSK